MDFDATMSYLRVLADTEVMVSIGQTLERPVAHMSGMLSEPEDFSYQVDQEGVYAFRVGEHAGFFLRRLGFQSAWAEDDLAGREALRIEHEDTQVRVGPSLPTA
ncbi:hypothetical protein [Candidatus Solirubrobacter pratensis]|uniref:hypothetical protein n=1 Tax=Candidatus Solirubrobacter pratensis TaxID=1298857 RepID=UPI0003F7B975|nr:hypothetical protein [Candidatus Solirubrobacter pratensis]